LKIFYSRSTSNEKEVKIVVDDLKITNIKEFKPKIKLSQDITSKLDLTDGKIALFDKVGRELHILVFER